MQTNDRNMILTLGIVVEGGLVLLAFAVGWVAGVRPLESFAWRWPAVWWGLAGTAPVFLLFLLSHRYPVGPLENINRFLIEVLGPPLSTCRWYELLLLATLAGIGEELLFRGTLQPWMESWGWGIVGALVASNVVFGLAHCITPTYAVVAGLIGIYLGLLLDAGGERNLLTPILTHGLYDFLAFVVVVDTYRKRQPIAAGHDPLATAGLEDF